MISDANMNGKLLLEDGTQFPGRRFGAVCSRFAEIVFNTSPVGYQEIVSDPSYTDQIVVMAYPLIGNYGITEDDDESLTPTLGGLVVREYTDEPSNFRSISTLSRLMLRYGIPGISGVDTRALVRSIRDCGSRRALIVNADVTLKQGLEMLRGQALPRDAVSRVSCRQQREFAVPSPKYRVVAVDCGMKLGIVRSLGLRGCSVTAVPWDTTADAVLALKPDGVVISNGPGDPTDVRPTIRLVRELAGKLPVFGICLGHQIIALAGGATTYKLKFGHRGGNHPVRELATGKIEVTSQNHSYAVNAESLAGTTLRVTHLNLLDGTVEGLEDPDSMLMSVQYHPEGAPGPRDSEGLFDRFTKMMEARKYA